MASSRPESNSDIVVFRALLKNVSSLELLNAGCVAILYIKCTWFQYSKFKKKIYLFDHVSSLKLSVIFQASFFLEEFDRERKIH